MFETRDGYTLNYGDKYYIVYLTTNEGPYKRHFENNINLLKKAVAFKDFNNAQQFKNDLNKATVPLKDVYNILEKLKENSVENNNFSSRSSKIDALKEQVNPFVK